MRYWSRRVEEPMGEGNSTTAEQHKDPEKSGRERSSHVRKMVCRLGLSVEGRLLEVEVTQG